MEEFQAKTPKKLLEELREAAALSDDNEKRLRFLAMYDGAKLIYDRVYARQRVYSKEHRDEIRAYNAEYLRKKREEREIKEKESLDKS